MSDITTAAKVKSFFNIQGTNLDTEIGYAIERVTKEIQNYCGRDLFSAQVTEYYNGEGQNVLFLNQYPVTAISSIHDDTDRVFGSDTLLDSDDYIFISGSPDSEAGILRLDGGAFCKGFANIKVVYTAGYSTIPADLEEAAIIKVGADLMLNKYIFNAPVIDGDAFIKDPGAMKKRVEELLRPYRRISL